MIPPTSASPDAPATDGVDDTVIVYESIPIFPIAVCVLLISVSGTLLIWYNSIAVPSIWAIESVSLTPLVKLDTVVPDIVPDTISDVPALFNNKVTVPELGNPVEDVNVKLVDEVVNAPLIVVDMSEDTPVIVTLFAALYIPWSLWLTFTVVELFVITKGLDKSLCP